MTKKCRAILSQNKKKMPPEIITTKKKINRHKFCVEKRNHIKNRITTFNFAINVHYYNNIVKIKVAL